MTLFVNDPTLRNVPRAILGVAAGQSGALALFGGTRQAFLTSLAPLVAFPAIGAIMSLASGDFQRAVVDFLASLAALLVPPVLSFAIAERWGREAGWPRFATAFNWCQLTLVLLALGTMTLGGAMLGRGISVALVGTLGLYGIWLHWFLGRHGLGLTSGRAAILVLWVHLGTSSVVLVPRILAGILRG